MRSKTDPAIEQLGEKIEELTKTVAKLRGEKDALSEHQKLVRERDALREELEVLKIEKDRRDEEFARERREIEHATGLHRKQSEWERTKAVDEAKITVREENLSAERTRFSEQIEFHKEQIRSEVNRMEKLISGLMDRLPTITVEKTVDLGKIMAGATNGKSNGNGTHEDE